MTQILAINTIIEWLPVQDDEAPLLERILWIDPTGEHVVLMPLSDTDSLPLWKPVADIEAAIESGSTFIRKIDPFAAKVHPDPAFLAQHRQRMEAAWNIIQDMVKAEPNIYLEDERGALIQEASEQFKTAKKYIYKFLKRYWKSGKTKYALLPEYGKCGGPGKARPIEANDTDRPKRGRPPKIARLMPDHVGVNVDEGHKKIFEISIRLYYDTRKKNSLQAAYQSMLERHFNVGYRTENGTPVPILPPADQYPTFEQFAYWHRKTKNLVHSLVSREGARTYALKRRPILGNSTQMASGPGSIFQIDATIGDVYLVSVLNRKWIIGRPVIYFVMDTFSRMIVGLYVGLEGPSWIGAMMALANAATDKVAFCARYDIDITPESWPCRYLPEQILADRGELLGTASDKLADALSIDMANCPPYRADWKGIVEQTFRKANLKSIHWLPGAVRKREPGERDHRLDAILDLNQFTRIMILTAIEHNLHHRIADYPKERDLIRDDVEPIPIELWEWGIVNRVGHLREKTPDIVRLNLMPTATARITAQGIAFKGMHYSTDRALREGWYAKARHEGTWGVQASYDPRRPGVIYLPGKDGFDCCELLPRDEHFRDVCIEDVEDFFAIEQARAQLHNERRRQSTAELNAQIRAIQDEAADMKENQGPSSQSKTQQVKGIRDNRTAEKERNRQEEAFDLRPEEAGEKKPGKLLPLRKGNDGPPQDEPSGPGRAAARRKEFLDILKDDSEEGI